ncbi:MAG TPA: UDP-N-acetylmuramoyl-L-alanyl-D-glutamate--2,6-diaminopimelate ligase [Acidimicrobiales bacterium]|nr:UDP-N-acetylmuramoyl-L-alanyl-D-glutamate--2,6-diaminopimelate ligase [Acidimicrobiales bacterium]
MSTSALVRLDELVEAAAPLAVLGDPHGVSVSEIAFDHREVTPGALFCCLPGARVDGHDFAAAARRAGAVAFLCEHSLGPELAGCVQLVVPPGTARPAMARVAAAFYGNPATAMRTVGVTGTNGKTTTTYLLRAIFEQYGWRAGVVGTLDGARTTPEAPHLQRALARQRDAGCAASAIEVTSHALVQGRVEGVTFDVAVFTNLTQDHLDFHVTMEAYFEAKSRLFRSERARFGVVNADDPYGRRLLERSCIPMLGYSLGDVRDLEIGVSASSFRLGGRIIRLGLGGEFNVYNALAAAAAARSLGVSADAIVAGLEAAPSVPGRFEAIAGPDGVTAVVDYAHTPAGLEEVLRAARRAARFNAPGDQPRERGDGRLIVVFGCGGDRDRGKRPAMGAIACEFADLVVLTSDNPRSESPATVIEEIRAGMPAGAALHVEIDRRRAIAAALGEARPGDIVIVAGKGHETTQQFADRAVRFDDREVVRDEFARLAAHRGDGAGAARAPQ